MNLQHDGQGFLSGDRVGSKQSGAPASALIGAIHRDVAIIRRLLTSGVGRSGGGRSRTRGSVEDAVESAVRSAIASPSVVRQAARSAVRQAVEFGARASVSPRARDSRGRFVGPASVSPGAGPITSRQAAVVAADSQRDSRGRFSGGGVSDRADGGGVIGRLSGAVERLGDAVSGADNIDPTIAALKEVREAVSPVGRGFMALHARLAERKKERWYSRILKAITGRRGEVSGGGSPGDVQSGSFFGTMLGELGGKLLGRLGGVAGGALGFIGTVLARVFAPVAAVWAAWEVGQWIGTKISDWLDKSGMSAKIIDAFISMTDWFKKQSGLFGRGFDEQANPAPGAPQKLPDADGFAQKAGRFAGAVRNLFKGSGKSRALQTGSAYSAGNIANLSDAETRALVASTALTESSGGQLGVVNDAGYMGRYQAGASWLAEAGLIKGGSASVKAAMARDGFSNEYEWGKAGGMTRFLKDGRNWNKGLNYDAYLASPEVQDLAFRDNSNAAYQSLLQSGAINKSTPTSVVAGALKARHIAGLGGARAALSGRSGASDANGTSAGKYFDDVANDRHGFVSAFSGGVAPVTASLQTIKPQSVPSPVPERVQVVQPDKTPERVGWGREARTVVVQKEEVGQDVRDRKLAHIVTGGIGG